jgi:uncharacterized RDD family membrane protein YckC
MPESPAPVACPLCGSDRYMGAKTSTLYGQPVCTKCYVGFANRRQFAFLVDCAISSLLVWGGLVWTGITPDPDTARGLSFVLFPIFGMKDGFGGSSPGKALMGVQVLREDTGATAGFGAAFKRNLILAVPLVPLFVAFRLASGKRWGDGWAHTRVICKKYRDRPPFAFTPTRTA